MAQLEEGGQGAEEGPAQKVIEAGSDEFLERIDDEKYRALGVG